MRMKDDDTLLAELRTFILSYGEHDAGCPGIDARRCPSTERSASAASRPALTNLWTSWPSASVERLGGPAGCRVIIGA